LLRPFHTPRGVALGNLQDAAVHLVLTSGFDCSLRVVVGHGDETESTRIPSLALRGDVAFKNTALTIQTSEEVIKMVGLGFVRQIPNVQFDGRRS
jgi:hypothetical protein